MLTPHSRIFIAGHRGLVGSACFRRFHHHGYTNLLVKSRQELDLTNRDAVLDFFQNEKPEFVVLAAAKVGGIVANRDFPVDFLLSNLDIQNNVLSAAHRSRVEKLLFLGSSCIYPKFAPQPISEDALLTGALEPTNDAYAIAKIAGIKLCQSYRQQHGTNFISAMPTNLYGPNDNFDLKSSHVLPALLRRFEEARTTGLSEVTLWGTGSPRREFLYVDDLADACLFLLKNYDAPEIINVGTGTDNTIKELAEKLAAAVGYTGIIRWDASYPDGTPRKLLNVDKLTQAGWKASITLDEGIARTLHWWREKNKS
jgi:GDP-L-fucose synthase